ncbi:MAG TPA: zinc dependent phospholipase C family protein [Chitinophagales bacterium]|nr:zinc dependent phospholipase C family protein [Chitinophagales bacterium]HRK28074.1 zinc dependent phospholipase C family protein [Chitinophagales bacterium]
MKKPSFKLVIILLLLAMALPAVLYFTHQPANAWGFWAHKRINRLAVFTLPPEMIVFYKKHLEFITEHAVDPDKRRYATVDEAPRHFIDIDRYGAYPFEELPRNWNEAVAKYTEDTLKAHGIVPWHIEVMLARLTNAFKERNENRILRLSAELGHYIADAHVPLHTSSNYNGQKTNQQGIHGFWESRIPELFAENYDYWVGKARFVSKPSDNIWTFVLQSAAAVDSVLNFERELTFSVNTDEKYCYETRAQTIVQTYCEGFSEQYANMLDGMVERRMRDAVLSIGSFWYTAWVKAGQPDLNNLQQIPLTAQEEQEQKELEQMFQKGEIKGREHPNH